MDSAVLAWLLARLGPTTDQNDLQTRYTRLGSARAVALEVLSERRAKLLADPLQLTVNGVVHHGPVQQPHRTGTADRLRSGLDRARRHGRH
ncbi:hypothetical protein ACWEO4_40970 [Streptomyces sp. NPDC004393]|uniref:hypothetical protein n=1 Tax=Streptomyces sp. NPDC004533 TaxID=3154278 RepID=UPI0033B18B15